MTYEYNPTPAQEDRSSIEYFWKEKGDVTRWVDWPRFAAANPAFAREWEAYKRTVRGAELLLEEAINKLG